MCANDICNDWLILLYILIFVCIWLSMLNKINLIVFTSSLGKNFGTK